MAVAARQLDAPVGQRRPSLRLVADPPPRRRRLPGRRRHTAVAYRRRRLALAGALLLSGLLLWSLWPAGTTAGQVEAPAPLVVVVGPGDTVWQLARPHTPAGEDPAAYVAEVVAANGLDARAVPPGTVLRLPRR